ncbi:hypothetical protein [Niabella hibiscisoli]|uniref:hypothetical protein n=1 Tax=Niabella hibiscisoli TaxID=1825928 RepID=UPI001F114480|nr:hypothetical protein [Niabella hibiscisoli]MCH5720338.1 hypothetical protein [Niabella hibiscisoli]
MKKWLLGGALIGFGRASRPGYLPCKWCADERSRYYAFTNATIVKDGNTSLSNATLVIKDGKVVAVGNVSVPDASVVVDCKGQFIYPSFVDIYSDYGIAVPQRPGGEGSFWSSAVIYQYQRTI